MDWNELAYVYVLRQPTYRNVVCYCLNKSLRSELDLKISYRSLKTPNINY